MTECYNFNKIYFHDGLFNKTIDATYIINLENNGRLDDINNQLKSYHPTNVVYIVFNKGYKKCKKDKMIINSAYDLVDANLNIFKHAKKENYNNILILEDDFEFHPDIKKPFHINNINNFLIKKANTIFQYYLGCIPLIMIPYDKYNYLNKSIGTHCVIFSKLHRNDILNRPQKDITDWDRFNNMYYNRYAYYRPLCYQLFLETENSTLWGVNESGLYSIILYLAPLFKKIINILELDKKTEPGYSYFYFFSKLLFYILVLLIIKISHEIAKKIRLLNINTVQNI